MIKYLFFSLILIFTINLLKFLIVVLGSKIYKEKILENIDLQPKFLIFETFALSIILSISFWIIERYLFTSNAAILFSLFVIPLIPSYNFIFSPLIYLFSKAEHKKDENLEKIIKKEGYNYNIIIIKGNIINAYATGILPFSKTILIGEILKKNMTEESLLSVIFHEIGHLKLNHLVKLYFINIFLSLVSILAFFARQNYLENLQFTIFEPLSIFILGLFIGLCFWYIPGKIQYKLEFEADTFASSIMGSEKYEIALKELDLLSKGDVSKGGITHPNLLNRIKNIYNK